MILYRSILLFPACILALTTTQVAVGSELLQKLIDCRALPSAVVRVDCYDQLVDAHAASTSQSPKTATAQQVEPVVTAPAATTAATEPTGDISPEALFGKDSVEVRQSVQEATGTEEIDRMDARVSKVRPSATGKAIITLDNGQVWTQIDNSRLRLSSYDQVIIRRASLGSFMLNKIDSKTSMRVKRIS
jgi:hypothetical protein